MPTKLISHRTGMRLSHIPDESISTMVRGFDKLHIYIIYIYIYRERKRQRERGGEALLEY
jgi:hypothetical protein